MSMGVKNNKTILPYNLNYFQDLLNKKKDETNKKKKEKIKIPLLKLKKNNKIENELSENSKEEEEENSIHTKIINSSRVNEKINEILTIKKKIFLRKNNSQDLLNSYSNYSQKIFRNTKYSDKNSFMEFYKKVHNSYDLNRKGVNNIKTPSFNFINGANEFKIIPNPIGIIKRIGNESIININHKRMGDNYILALIKSLNVINHIHEISLSQNRLTDFGISALCHSIINNNELSSKLTILDLSYNNLGENSVFSLGKLLDDSNSNLEHLNIEGNLFGNRLIIYLIKKIIKSKSFLIRYLNFGANNINDDCASEMALLVKNCIYLKVFILYQNNFKNFGMSLIMSELKKHIYIKFLDISWNLIGSNLSEDIPTREELIKDNKDNKNRVFNNAELEEIRMTLKFPKPTIVSSLSKSKSLPDLNLKKNIISPFVKELCELFKNEDIELLHLDISHNNIGYFDCKQIENDVKFNHSILGIHVDGNNMFIDELGFIHAVDKLHYEKNHFASSQIFYRINNEHPLIKSNILNVKKIRGKNNCWICEGWREKYFEYDIKEVEKIPSPFPDGIDKCHIHFNFENFNSFEMSFNEIKKKYICYRMCPPGNLIYFYSYNNIPCLKYDEDKILNLKEAIIHEETIKLKDDNNESNNLYLEDNSPQYLEKKFIITKVANEKVEINPQVIDSKLFLKLIKFCVPRPEKQLFKKKKERIPWKFSMSIWAYYKYNYEGEDEKIYDKAFEYDYQRGQYENDKDLTDQRLQKKLKSDLRKYYPKLIDCYRSLSSILGWKIWQIGQNSISEFATNCPNLLDNKYLINDVLVKLTETKSNQLDKDGRKKNINIPDNIIRHQWMMLLVKISKDKYYRTKLFDNIPEAVEYSFENHYLPYLSKFCHNDWRQKRYYNEYVDNTIKAYLPIFDGLYNSYATQKKIGRKDSISIWLDEFTTLINKLMDSDFPVKEIPTIYNVSMRLQENEIDFDKHYNMIFPEFLEAICRFIDKLSPVPENENKFEWTFEKRNEQDLYIKIENLIPSIMKIIKPKFKNLKEKFVLPVRDAETGLLTYDMTNEFYVGLHPPRLFGMDKK